MQINLSGRTILLGVTGSISAYKACEVARLFVKAEADVYVVMTPAAERFVSPLTFEALTRNPVLTEKTESWSSELNHIELGKMCDLFVIAPASANTINKLSAGIADNILTQTALAFSGAVVVAPAANTNMLQNPYTRESLETLRGNHCTVVEPQEKLLACGDTGSGALAEPLEIFHEGCRRLLKDLFWENRPVIVTGGGTREKIDEVRYISNYSSGKMAKALSLSLYLKGAQVSYITTTGSEGLPGRIQVIGTEDTESMLQHTRVALQIARNRQLCAACSTPEEASMFEVQRPYLFMVAAVSDYTPEDPQQGKMKKSMLGNAWSLALKQTTDILSSLDREGIATVAFKAEMDSKNGLNHARSLLETKNVDAVCYNLLKDSSSFGTEENEIIFVTRTEETPLGKDSKFILSEKILALSKALPDE